MTAITISGTSPTLKPGDEDERFAICVPNEFFSETDPFLEKDGAGCITT
jgi:hypothetical protein